LWPVFVATCGFQILAFTSTKEESSLLLLRRVLMLMSLTSFILCIIMAASSIQHVSSCTTLVRMTMDEGRRGVIHDVSVECELRLRGCDAPYAWRRGCQLAPLVTGHLGTSKCIVGVAACCGVLQSMVQRVFSLELAAQSPNMTSFSTAESLQLLQQDMDEYRSINDDLIIQHPPARDDPHVRASSS
jgi:hypothetical protein